VVHASRFQSATRRTAAPLIRPWARSVKAWSAAVRGYAVVMGRIGMREGKIQQLLTIGTGVGGDRPDLTLLEQPGVFQDRDVGEVDAGYCQCSTSIQGA
jgi:hypothetical protein